MELGSENFKFPKTKIDHIRLKSCRIGNSKRFSIEIGCIIAHKCNFTELFHDMTLNYCKRGKSTI